MLAQTARTRGPWRFQALDALTTTWTGNRGTGTSGYRDYDRAVTLSGTAKPDLLASADPHFRGDGTRWNPEELLLAALAESAD